MLILSVFFNFTKMFVITLYMQFHTYFTR